MKKIQYNDLNTTELAKHLKESQDSLRASRFAMAGSRPKDVKSNQKTRRNIARILTALKKTNAK